MRLIIWAKYGFGQLKSRKRIQAVFADKAQVTAYMSAEKRLKSIKLQPL